MKVKSSPENKMSSMSELVSSHQRNSFVFSVVVVVLVVVVVVVVVVGGATG